MKTLPVIFRYDAKGLGFKYADPVTAVFPTLEWAPGQVACYAHVGQHSGCTRLWYQTCTRPATPEEYAPLLAEVRRVYESDPDAVKLRIVTRWTKGRKGDAK